VPGDDNLVESHSAFYFVGPTTTVVRSRGGSDGASALVRLHLAPAGARIEPEPGNPIDPKQARAP
jgi:hypothetical protein